VGREARKIRVIPETFTVEWVPTVDGCQPCPDKASHRAVKTRAIIESSGSEKSFEICGKIAVKKKCHVNRRGQVADWGSSDVICVATWKKAVCGRIR
jgi:hypothetical protein